MLAIILLGLLAATANAGVIGGLGHGGLVVAHGVPTVVAAPVVVGVKTHLATSWANSNSIAVHPHAIAVPSATLVHAAPVLHGAPLVLGHGIHGGLLH